MTPAVRSRRILLAAILAAGLPAAARALDATLQLVPSYGFSTDRSSGSVSSYAETSQLAQRYRLSLGQELLPRLRLDGGGLLNWNQDWRLANRSWATDEQKTWSGDLRLSAGADPLSGQLYYTRQQTSADSTNAEGRSRQPDQIRETTGFSGTWAPAELPRITALLSRSHAYDSPRASLDSVTDVGSLSAAYALRSASARYAFNYSQGESRLSGARSTSTGHTGQLGWSEAFLDRRLGLSASYTLTSGRTTVSASGAVSVPVQQLPQAGLSVVEPPTATPGLVKLSSSPSLIDGNLAVGAGVELGWGPAAAGDTRLRDVGASFADPLTQVDLIYLWVDRRLPASVSAALSFTAYRSDDGEHWTAVAPSGPVQFGTFDNRFEIPLASTRAPYLKVVARPLALGVTSDGQYTSILVTELQLYRLVSSAQPALSSLSGVGTVAGRLALLPALNLTYDTSASVSHASATSSPDRLNWNLANSLSLARQLDATYAVRSRLDHALARTRLASGEVAQNDLRLTAGLDAAWLASLRSSLTYQGQVGFASSALSRTYSALLFNAGADPYPGISLLADGSYTRGRDGATRAAFSTTGANCSLSLQPNPHVTASATISYSGAENVQADGSVKHARAGLGTASVLVAPFSALYGSASVTRYFWLTPATTVVNLSGNFSPLQGGQLLLTISYVENIDLGNGVRYRAWGPQARWAIRPGASLTASFNRTQGDFPTYRTLTDAVQTQLMITL